MGGFNFWRKWLLAVSVYLVFFGMFLAFWGQSVLMNLLFNNQIDPAFWQTGGMPESAKDFQAWIYGVLGCVLSGWAVFMAFLVQHPFKNQEKWAWNCFALGILLWFITDTGLSAFYGVTFNVIFNIILLLLTGIPLLFTRKYFTV